MQRWRERRPLGPGRLPRRLTDRVEDGLAWALTATGLFVLIISVLAGVHKAAEVGEQGRIAERQRIRVEATVLRPPVEVAQESDSDPPGWVSVQYTDGVGRVHDADVQQPGQFTAGTRVPVWVDRSGQVVSAPPGTLDAVVLGAMVGLATAVAGVLLLVVTWTAVRRVLNTRNAAAWAREWATVEPEWSGRRR